MLEQTEEMPQGELDEKKGEVSNEDDKQSVATGVSEIESETSPFLSTREQLHGRKHPFFVDR